MDKTEELEIKRAKLKEFFNSLTILEDFESFLTSDLKLKINENLEKEATERNKFSGEETQRAKDLRDIKYKLV